MKLSWTPVSKEFKRFREGLITLNTIKGVGGCHVFEIRKQLEKNENWWPDTVE
jgi:hypothetical protein